jgi:hypothetical protein
MDTSALIASYTNDVARRLPRKLRNEVGLELRALLTDQVNAAAADAGRAPDSELALRVLKNFGRPDEVAARYHHAREFNVIEPAHAPVFVKLAAFCVLAQWALTLPRVFSSSLTFGDWWLGWGAGALWWVGLLTVWFGVAGWIQRRSPIDPHSFVRPWTHYIVWVPTRDWLPGHDVNLYAGAKVIVPLVSVLTVFFISPATFLNYVLPGNVDTSWARYDADFQRWLLTPLIALMAARLALFTLAVVDERLRARTEPVRLGLWIAFVGLLVWSAARWDIFASVFTDALFKAWLSIFLLVNCLQIYTEIRRALARVRVPKTLTQRQGVRADTD